MDQTLHDAPTREAPMAPTVVSIERTRMPPIFRHFSYIHPTTRMAYKWDSCDQSITFGWSASIPHEELEEVIPGLFDGVYDKFVEENPDLAQTERPKFDWGYVGGRSVLWVEFPKSGLNAEERTDTAISPIVPPFPHYLEIVSRFAKKILDTEPLRKQTDEEKFIYDRLTRPTTAPISTYTFVASGYGCTVFGSEAYSVDYLARDCMGLFACMAMYPSLFTWTFKTRSSHAQSFQTRFGIILYLFTVVQPFCGPSNDTTDFIFEHTREERYAVVYDIATVYNVHGRFPSLESLQYIFRLKDNITAETIINLLPEQDTDENYPLDARGIVINCINYAFTD